MLQHPKAIYAIYEIDSMRFCILNELTGEDKKGQGRVILTTSIALRYFDCTL